MNYPDIWVFKFDDETIVKDIEHIDYSKYLERGEIPLNAWKNIDLSYHENENLIQKVIISQAQVLSTFFNTEAVCNDNKPFQEYSQHMIKFIKAEMIYCYHFWKYSTFKDFVRNRLNATLVRTFRFLKSLQVYVLNKFIIEKELSSDFNYEANPHHEALNDYLEDMLVEYQDLKTIISYFSKSYGDLFNKMQKYKPQFETQVEMIGKIYVLSTTFFDINPKAIEYPVLKAFKKDPEKPLLLELFTYNDQTKAIVEQKKRQKFKDEEDLQIERYFQQSIALNSVLRQQREIDDPTTAKRNSGWGSSDLSPGERVKPKSGFKERLRLSSTEILDTSQSESENNSKVRNDYQKNRIAHMNSTLTDKSSKDYSSLADVLKTSVDNPYKKSMTNPLLTISNSQTMKALSKTKPISEVLFRSDSKLTPKSVGTNSSVPTPSQKTSVVKTKEPNEYDEKLNYSISHEVIEEMISKKLEPQRFRILEKIDEDDLNLRKISFKRQNLRFFSRVDVSEDYEIQSVATSSPSTNYNRKRSLSRKKSDFIDFDSTVLDDNSSQKYVPYRENRGQDIADEKILGNLIANDDSRDSKDEDSLILELLKTGQDYRSRFITKIKAYENDKIFPISHQNLDKYSINLSREDEVFKQRHKHKWSIVQDNLKGAICQKQIYEIQRNEDPTDGSGIVPRRLNYLARRKNKLKSSEIDLKELSAPPQAAYKILTVKNENNEEFYKAVKASILT